MAARLAAPATTAADAASAPAPASPRMTCDRAEWCDCAPTEHRPAETPSAGAELDRLLERRSGRVPPFALECTVKRRAACGRRQCICVDRLPRAIRDAK